MMTDSRNGLLCRQKVRLFFTAFLSFIPQAPHSPVPLTPSLNFLILSVTLGAFLLAAIYHGLLYLHQREEKLLRYYTLYFSTITVYLLYRATWWREQSTFNPPWGTFPLDEVLQMITFGVYIHFLCLVMGLKRSQRVVWAFWRLTPYVLGVHIVSQIYCGMALGHVTSVPVTLWRAHGSCS